MLFFEIVALLVVAVVLMTVVISIGRPVAMLLAEKAHFKYKGLDSEAEARLITRIEGLEEELRQTRNQLVELKDSVEFNKTIGSDKNERKDEAARLELRAAQPDIESKK